MKKFITVLCVLCILSLSACGVPANISDSLPPIDDNFQNSGGNDIDNGNGGEPPVVPGESDQPDAAPDPETPSEPELPEEPDSPEEPEEVKDLLVKSNTDSLTIRSGPGANYSAIGYLDKNDMAAFIGKNGNWYIITYKRRIAYVSVSYASIVEFAKASQPVEQMIDQGKQLLGVPYVLGAQRYHWGNGVLNENFTGASFDCSSLTQYIYKKAMGINLGVTTRDQAVQGKYVAKSDLKRGDLMFFTNSTRYNNTGIERIGHVAVYLGDNYILHTASDHAVIEPISATRWKYYITSRRFV